MEEGKKVEPLNASTRGRRGRAARRGTPTHPMPTRTSARRLLRVENIARVPGPPAGRAREVTSTRAVGGDVAAVMTFREKRHRDFLGTS